MGQKGYQGKEIKKMDISEIIQRLGMDGV